MPHALTSDLYARKSNTDAGRSAARQERAWRADCAAEGFTVGRVFVDPESSASRFSRKGRPDYDALVEHIEANTCEMVSLWEPSRASRKMDEWVPFLTLCRDKGVLIRVFGMDGGPVTFDPRRHRDRDALIKDGLLAEGESERLSIRVCAGMADAASQGRPHGKVLDGYKRIYETPTDDTRALVNARGLVIRQVVDEPRAKIYRDAAEGILNGVPADFIARVLNAWEVPTPTGAGRWTGGALLARLLRPGMEGHRDLNGDVITRDAWPPILDKDTAARLRALRQAPRVSRARASTERRHLLSGVLLCGLCRKPMQGFRAAGRRGARYECMKIRGGCCRLGVLLDETDQVVAEMVLARLREPGAGAVFETSAEPDARVEAAQAEVDALLARQKELFASAARPGGPSMALVAAAERELAPAIEAASRRLRVLRTPAALRGFDRDDLVANWDSYPVGDRRVVVSALAEPVVSAVGRGGRWSRWRLAESRWRGQDRTWGDLWRGAGLSSVPGA